MIKHNFNFLLFFFATDLCKEKKFMFHNLFVEINKQINK
jgi:hypothetical protein